MLRHQIVRVRDDDPEDVTVLLDADLLEALLLESAAHSRWLRRRRNRKHILAVMEAAVAGLKEQTVGLP